MDPHTNPPTEPSTTARGAGPARQPGDLPQHPTRVERELSAHLAGPAPRTLRMVLRYDLAAPYEVSICFPAPAVLADGLVVEDGGRAEDGVVWTVARELLADGIRHPAGQGDLRLRPAGTGLTRLEFYGDGGVALLHTDSADLAAFLAETERALPVGGEHRLIVWPDTVEALLRYADRG
ncbi:SsgA family sporulation/cell division regulator [Kitasatospora sp. NPDC057015]|uniref:SsgA family sporulation/cell division regulator n=1 Tax=Kitasatospora sp. NPDC057015 TaxID=3346001 RepID=UPI00363376BC